MLTQRDARTRVARGAALLDEQVPGWVDQIDLGTLTLHDMCACIIGQLCGGLFSKGLSRLGFPPFGTPGRAELVYAHGFDAPYTEGEARYDTLQDAWVEVIADRRLRAATLTPVGSRRCTLPAPPSASSPTETARRSHPGRSSARD